MLKSHVFLESKNHRVRCAPPVRHCPAGPPARKRTRGGTSGSNRGPASRTTGRRTRGGTGGSNRGPASRTTAPLAKEICNLKFQIYFFKNIFVRVSELLTSLLFRGGDGGGAGRILFTYSKSVRSHAISAPHSSVSLRIITGKASKMGRKPSILFAEFWDTLSSVQKMHSGTSVVSALWNGCTMRFSTVKSRDDGFFRPCAKTLHFEVSKFSEQTAIFDQKRHAKIIAGMSPTSFGRAFRRLPGNTLARCDSCGVRTRSRVIDWASTPWRTCQCWTHAIPSSTERNAQKTLPKKNYLFCNSPAMVKINCAFFQRSKLTLIFLFKTSGVSLCLDVLATILGFETLTILHDINFFLTHWFDRFSKTRKMRTSEIHLTQKWMHFRVPVPGQLNTFSSWCFMFELLDCLTKLLACLGNLPPALS